MFGKPIAIGTVDPPPGFQPGIVDGVVQPHTPEILDLIPIPLAIVASRKGGFVVEAHNQAFDKARIGALLSDTGARIDEFLASGEASTHFAWCVGGEIDARHYRVTLARRAVNAGIERCMMTVIDQTSEFRTETSLRREMMSDSLTGLPNRAAFSDTLESMMADGPKARAAAAVLMIDLDRFSRVNACLGALAGDELLISVARRIKSALRARDVLARTGGDEFGILMTLDDGPDDAAHVAKRVQAALATPFQLSDFEIRVACSIGIAFGSDAVEDAEELIRHAQFAVKRSKTSGAAETYQTQAFDVVREQFGLETELRRAIEREDLRLTFQPIWDLASGRIVAFETLCRWRNERGEEIEPTDFIPVAEESGLIVPLGRWAMEKAARTLVEWDARAGGNCGVTVAVNLSAIQLHRDNIAPLVESVLGSVGLAGERLTLELTESALISDPDRIAGTMHALKRLGTTLAMDDFGTGYSNLAYLQKLPIDLLKIDRSFVTGMLADRDKVSIVRAILSLAQALGMKTTAEGIETIELAQTLTALGCVYGQGYLYARPLEGDAAYSLLAARNA